MPLYEYKCEDCGVVIEGIGYARPGHDVWRELCEDCGGYMLRQFPAPAMIQGKGYTTIKQHAPDKEEG